MNAHNSYSQRQLLEGFVTLTQHPHLDAAIPVFSVVHFVSGNCDYDDDDADDANKNYVRSS